MRATKNKNKKRLSLLGLTLLPFNILVVIALIGAYLAPYVNPESFIWFSFLGLGHPFLLLVNILFVIFWMFRRKWLFLISLISIAIGWSHLQSLIQFNISNTEQSANLKVVSYNVKYQGRFLVGEEKINVRNEILNTLCDLKADIYCFQEFHTNPKSISNNNLKSVLKRLKPINYFTTKMSVNEDNFNELGLAFFSKYPILSKQTIYFNNTANMGAFIDVLYNKDTIRIYNMHLASIKFKPDDYKFIENIDANKSEEEIKKGSKNIYNRLKIAFIKRGLQANIMAKHISKSPYPVIVCGDFNDTPTSYAYNVIKGIKLKDSFVEKGFGLAKTYNGSMPSFRIDHILSDTTFTVQSYKVVTTSKASDHFPVVVELTQN